MIVGDVGKYDCHFHLVPSCNDRIRQQSRKGNFHRFLAIEGAAQLVFCSV